MSARNFHVTDDIEASSNRIHDINEFPWTRKPRRKLTGLLNQGGTCYLNTLLQTLLHAPEFTYRLFKLAREVGKANLKRMIQEMLNLFSALITNGGGAISSKPLTDSFGWSDEEVCVHQDIQELNRLLFEQIEIALKNTPESSLINDLFRGIQCTRIRCLKCGRISERNDEFHDINLSVMEHDSVEDCLTAHTQMEQLTGDNKYFCEGCKMKVDAVKMTRFAELPPILTISLSRFYFDAKLMQSVKLEKMCSFPLILDMSSFLINKPYERMKYDLFSVVLHVGGSTRGGHYHAYIKDPYGTTQENARDNSLNNEFDQLVGVMHSETTYPSKTTSSSKHIIHDAGESMTDTVEQSFKNTYGSSPSYCHPTNRTMGLGIGDGETVASWSEKETRNPNLLVMNMNLAKQEIVQSDQTNPSRDELRLMKQMINQSPNESKNQDSQPTVHTSHANIHSHLPSGGRGSNYATITEMVGRMCLTRKASSLSNIEPKKTLTNNPDKRLSKTPGNCDSKTNYKPKSTSKNTTHVSSSSANTALPVYNRTTDAVAVYPAKSRVQSLDSMHSRSHSLNISTAGISDPKNHQRHKQTSGSAIKLARQPNCAHPPAHQKTVKNISVNGKIAVRSNDHHKIRTRKPQSNQHNSVSERSNDSSQSSSSVRFPFSGVCKRKDVPVSVCSFNSRWHSKLFDPPSHYTKDINNALLPSYDVNPSDMLESTNRIDAHCPTDDGESMENKQDLEWIPSFRRTNARILSRLSDCTDAALVSSAKLNMMIQPGQKSSTSAELEHFAYTENSHSPSDVTKNDCSKHYATSTTHNESNDTRGYSEAVVGRWFDINDDYIAEVDPSTFDRVFEGPECAYMLFYRLISLPMPITTL